MGVVVVFIGVVSWLVDFGVDWFCFVLLLVLVFFGKREGGHLYVFSSCQYSVSYILNFFRAGLLGLADENIFRVGVASVRTGRGVLNLSMDTGYDQVGVFRFCPWTRVIAR